MDALGFIEDKFLRERIENAVEYSTTLFSVLDKKSSHNEVFKEETYRVVILYAVSCIEAILLYFYKTRKEKIEMIEYKHINVLSEKFKCVENEEAPLVIAMQIKNEKNQIGLYDLVKYFESKKLIKAETVKELLNLNEIRNTHHLIRNRERSCTPSDAETAFRLLNYTIDRAPKVLKKK